MIVFLLPVVSSRVADDLRSEQLTARVLLVIGIIGTGFSIAAAAYTASSEQRSSLRSSSVALASVSAIFASAGTWPLCLSVSLSLCLSVSLSLCLSVSLSLCLSQVVFMLFR
jgi:hypothetical protein